MAGDNVTSTAAAAPRLLFEWLHAHQPCVLFGTTHAQDGEYAATSWGQAFLGCVYHSQNRASVSVERVQHAKHISAAGCYTVALCNVILEGSQPIRRIQYAGVVKNCSHPARRLRLLLEFTTMSNGMHQLTCPDQEITIQYDLWKIADWNTLLVFRPPTSRQKYDEVRAWRALGPDVPTAPAMDVWPWITGFLGSPRAAASTAQPHCNIPVAAPSTPVTRFLRHRLYDPHLLRLIVHCLNAPSLYRAVRHQPWVTTLPADETRPWHCVGCGQWY